MRRAIEEREVPAAKQLELEQEGEANRVIQWRRDELERAGYDTLGAKALAERLDVDLHYAIDLLRSGCPAETAVKILL
jgi:hypothetical protein